MLIVPAREGTLRVLRASLDAGVKRIVVTSSVAAFETAVRATRRFDRGRLDRRFERKPHSVRALEDLGGAGRVEVHAGRGAADRLAVVNPGAILGPALSDDHSYSLELVERMLGGMPGMPRLGFSIVDVRDVADLEIAAMTTPAAGGERFIAAGQFLWMSDAAAILRERLGDAAAKVPHRKVPNFVVRAMARFIQAALRDRRSGPAHRLLDREGEADLGVDAAPGRADGRRLRPELDRPARGGRRNAAGPLTRTAE